VPVGRVGLLTPVPTLPPPFRSPPCTACVPGLQPHVSAATVRSSFSFWATVEQPQPGFPSPNPQDLGRVPVGRVGLLTPVPTLPPPFRHPPCTACASTAGTHERSDRREQLVPLGDGRAAAARFPLSKSAGFGEAARRAGGVARAGTHPVCFSGMTAGNNHIQVSNLPPHVSLRGAPRRSNLRHHQ